MCHSRQVGVCELPHVTEARAKVLLSFFFSKSKSDVIGGDHTILRKAQGATFSTAEEDVGGDGREGISQELESRVSRVSLDQEEQVLCAFEDGHGAGRGSRSGVGLLSRWHFLRPFRTPDTRWPRATGGRAWSWRNWLLMVER